MTAAPSSNTPPPFVSNALLEQSLNNLHIAVGKVEGLITAFHERMNQMELARVTTTAEFKHRLDNHEHDIAELQEAVKPIAEIQTGHRILVWIGGALGLSVIALIWMFITGQATVIFN